MGLSVLLHLLLSRCPGISGVLDRFGLLAVTVHADLAGLAYILFGGSNKGLTHPTAVTGRDAACFTSEARAYRSLRGRGQVL